MNQISGQMSLFDIAVRTTQQPSEDRLEPKPIADYEWHDIDTPPNDCDYCLFEYTYNKYHANDSIGVCEGWWDADRKSVLWNNMPIDIGKKTVTRYIRIPEWLKYNFTPECEHNSKCLCNRWFGSDEERQSKKDNLPKGYACAGCCWYCSEAPQHGGKCKHECRVFKDVLIKGVFGYEKIQNS